MNNAAEFILIRVRQERWQWLLKQFSCHKLYRFLPEPTGTQVLRVEDPLYSRAVNVENSLISLKEPFDSYWCSQTTHARLQPNLELTLALTKGSLNGPGTPSWENQDAYWKQLQTRKLLNIA